jgi:hypothetical protein
VSLAGLLPKDLGFIDLEPTEMMFWMYCPISIPGMYGWVLPDNLKQFDFLVEQAICDFDPFRTNKWFREHYAYLTAKTLFVSGDSVGNRPGWHCDGFGTKDINYIWSDRCPTEFLSATPKELSSDCEYSMIQMRDMADFPLRFGSRIVTYPDKHLLRLDPSNIHRSPVNVTPGMRTFLKVSISKDRYDLEGNSINHLIPSFEGPRVPRREARNHPASVQ